jgi:hypothetical protein
VAHVSCDLHESLFVSFQKSKAWNSQCDLRLSSRTFFAGPVSMARIEKVNKLMDMSFNATWLHTAGVFATSSWHSFVKITQPSYHMATS